MTETERQLKTVRRQRDALQRQFDEIERQLKCALYECDGLQKRLDAIRKKREEILHLLDTPTLAEHLDAGGSVFDVNPSGAVAREKWGRRTNG